MAAFEQSLGNMTIRLQSLTMTAEQKVKHAFIPACLDLTTNLKTLFSFILGNCIDFSVFLQLLKLSENRTYMKTFSDRPRSPMPDIFTCSCVPVEN